MRLSVHRSLLTATHDTVMAAASFLLALYLRYGNVTDATYSTHLPAYTALCMVICVAAFAQARLYRGLWRYAGMADLVAILRAVTLALLIFYLLLFSLSRLEDIPRSVPFIHWLLLVAAIGAPRFLYRIWRDGGRALAVRGPAQGERIPVLLIGAGDAAELFLRDTRAGASSHYSVVGILGDEPSQTGHTIHNVRIYGTADNFAHVVGKLARHGMKPQKAVVADDRLTGPRLRALLAEADKLGLPLARLPRLSEFKPGRQERLDIRPIAVEDLLGRAQNIHDKTRVEAQVKGKTVLITGAGGSIGSELVRQVAGFGPRRLILLDSSEYALYQIDMEIGRSYPALARRAVIGDVRSRDQLAALFAAEKPVLVFHAAAIKHVPLAEANPEEAVLTNVFGTQCVADACLKYGAAVMVLISTDKAVNPANVMGASKRAAEQYCQSLAAGNPKGTRFVAVRFGNVLGSTGSVVPLFQQQLAQGGPLTVTHPDMVRFFMTVREAVELVLQAATLSDGTGEVYVLDMGQPVKILDLAEQMIRLAGLKPYDDIKIAFTGLRPGEKMFEELFLSSENHTRTAHESIWLAQPPYLKLDAFQALLAELQETCGRRNAARAVELLRHMVPEFRHPEEKKSA